MLTDNTRDSYVIINSYEPLSSSICFPGNTPIKTDQGPLNKINKK